MERYDFDKIMLIKKYMQVLSKAPKIYLDNQDKILEFKSSLKVLETLILNKKHFESPFAEIEYYNRNNHINANLETYYAYRYYNNLILDSKVNIKDEYLWKIDLLFNNEKNQITYDEMLEKVNDFFKSLPDKDINNNFNTLYKEENNNIRLKNSNPYTFTIPMIDTFLVTLDKRCPYSRTMYDLIHEYGHGIQMLLNKNLNYYGNDYRPVELLPIFFSLLKASEEHNESSFIEIGLILSSYTTYARIIQDTEEIETENYKSFLNNHDKDYIQTYNSYSLLECYSYIIPILTSLELLEEYKKDPEIALLKAKKLIGEGDYRNLLKENNIELGKHTKKLIKELTNNEAL